MTGFREKFPSLKSFRPLPCRSILEADALCLLEFSPGVKRIASYQTATHYYIDQQQFTTFPDYEATLLGDDSVIVEAHSEKKLQPTTDRKKYQAIAQEFRRQGRQYRLLRETEIYREPRYSNLQRLLYHRRDLGGKGAIDELLDWPRRFPELTFKALREHYGDIRVVLRLLAHGLLRFDADAPLNDAALISVRRQSDAYLLF